MTDQGKQQEIEQQAPALSDDAISNAANEYRTKIKPDCSTEAEYSHAATDFISGADHARRFYEAERLKALDREKKVQELIEAGDAMRHELFECRKSSEERSELRVRWDKSLRALRALRALTTNTPTDEPK